MKILKLIVILGVFGFLSLKAAEMFNIGQINTSDLYDYDSDLDEEVNQIVSNSNSSNLKLKEALRPDTPLPTLPLIPISNENEEKSHFVENQEETPTQLNESKPKESLNEEEKLKEFIGAEIPFLEFSLKKILDPKLRAKQQLELGYMYLIKNKITAAYDLFYQIIHNPYADLNTFAEALLNLGQIYENGSEEIDINLDYAKDSYNWILKHPLEISREIRADAEMRLQHIEDEMLNEKEDTNIIRAIDQEEELIKLISKINKLWLINQNLLSQNDNIIIERIIKRANKFVSSEYQEELSEMAKYKKDKDYISNEFLKLINQLNEIYDQLSNSKIKPLIESASADYIRQKNLNIDKINREIDEQKEDSDFDRIAQNINSINSTRHLPQETPVTPELDSFEL